MRLSRTALREVGSGGGRLEDVALAVVQAVSMAQNPTDGAHATKETCRRILRGRVRYHLAQREAEIRPQAAPVLDLIALAELEEFAVDIPVLADTLKMPQAAVRDQVVSLIKDGWIEAAHAGGSVRLKLTQKGRQSAADWINLALEA